MKKKTQLVKPSTKKLTPASIISQKHRRRQESFLPVDAAYLSSNPKIKLGKKINEGTEGAVYQVAGNRNLVVKVPIGFVDEDNYTKTPSSKERAKDNRRHATKDSKESIRVEAHCYENLDFNDKPLFIPTKIVNMGSNDLGNGDYIGLVRPKVAPVMDFHDKVAAHQKKRMTDTQLETIRQKLMELSLQGYAFVDGLQIGLDKANRPLIYDAGKLQNYGWNNPRTYQINNQMWVGLLYDIGKIPANDRWRDYREKYGEVEQQKQSDWW